MNDADYLQALAEKAANLAGLVRNLTDRLGKHSYNNAVWTAWAAASDCAKHLSVAAEWAASLERDRYDEQLSLFREP